MSKQLTFALSLILLGCVMPTPYAPNTGSGGYTETKIDDTHYRVKYDGNGRSSKERIWSFWLYRCAELTKEKGFAYFALDTGTSNKQTAFAHRPEAGALHRASFHSRNQRHGRLVRAGGHGVPIVTYRPGYSYTITTWHSNAIVAMYGPDDLPPGVVVMDAQAVLDDLSPYLKSDGESAPMDRQEVFKHAARRLGPTLKIVKVFKDNGEPGVPPLFEPNRGSKNGSVTPKGAASEVKAGS